jgi:multiple antibiotic resistance protein
MNPPLTLFISVFTTLLAIINPLEAVPVFLKLLEGKDDATHLRVARRSCLYAALLMFFFLVFGTLILRVFGVPLSMVRIVGGIVLMRIGFELFSPSTSGNSIIAASGGPDSTGDDVTFVPLAMPIMFGPGGIATILGMTSLIKESEFEILSFVAVVAAIVATMGMGLIFHGLVEALHSYGLIATR